MGGGTEWDSRMMDTLKNFDLNSPAVKQQFDQIGLSPEEVISKIMANPDFAMAFQNPRVQEAIMDLRRLFKLMKMVRKSDSNLFRNLGTNTSLSHFEFTFHWLDLGNGKTLDLERCSRSKLRKQCIKYLGPQERENYEYVVCDGKIINNQSGDFLHTKKDSEDAKWIFVMSTEKKLYAGKKKKGLFHHSSFLAGGATLAAGRLEAEDGVLKSISAYSGHYRPTDETLDAFLSYLREN
ncbi:hypothetical protein RYX36_024591, partial [Vicia faba]